MSELLFLWYPWQQPTTENADLERAIDLLYLKELTQEDMFVCLLSLICYIPVNIFSVISETGLPGSSTLPLSHRAPPEDIHV